MFEELRTHLEFLCRVFLPRMRSDIYFLIFHYIYFLEML